MGLGVTQGSVCCDNNTCGMYGVEVRRGEVRGHTSYANKNVFGTHDAKGISGAAPRAGVGDAIVMV